MANNNFRNSYRYPDPSMVQDKATRTFLFDFITAIRSRDSNIARLPINKDVYPVVTALNVVDVLQSLLDDLQKAGIIK